MGNAGVTAHSAFDVLSDKPRCQRDIPYLQSLGINTIYIDTAEPRFDHRPCMQLLQQAGIYVMVEIAESANNQGLTTENGMRYSKWDYQDIADLEATVDIYSQFDNTLGFSVFMGDYTPSGVAQTPWRKAVVRDLKAYIASKNYRNIPVGALVREHALDKMAQFINCGDRANSADFLALQRRWGYLNAPVCSKPGEFLEPGIADDYRNYSIPAFFFYGCNTKERGDFSEVQEIYGNISSRVFSGGVGSEWYPNPQYGGDSGTLLASLDLFINSNIW
jgi:1,3-beta-glucanosyltransferase GAS1